ncbi:MAG: hypothetical protein ACE5K0_07870 [Candidatus Methanofastidiosia archaeon]
MKNKNLQKTQTSDFVRLFEYVKAISQEIGEDKALKILENCVCEKRIKWIDENKDKLGKGSDVEIAFKIFLFDYLKISPKDIEIVEKDSKKITYRSYNFCPVLEACKILSLDTRVICKKVYEKPVQVFLSKINPKLKFRRNYEKIRPYSNFCEEMIEIL